MIAGEAADFLRGRTLNEESIMQAAALAARMAKPLDNTDFDLSWRKKVAAHFVANALHELRGDDVRIERERVTKLQVDW